VKTKTGILAVCGAHLLMHLYFFFLHQRVHRLFLPLCPVPASTPVSSPTPISVPVSVLGADQLGDHAAKQLPERSAHRPRCHVDPGCGPVGGRAHLPVEPGRAPGVPQ
jgi:hypothetical protein